MLRILNHVFEEDFSERESHITFINDNDNRDSCVIVDCIFLEKEIEDDVIRPIIRIDRMYTKTKERVTLAFLLWRNMKWKKFL